MKLVRRFIDIGLLTTLLIASSSTQIILQPEHTLPINRANYDGSSMQRNPETNEYHQNPKQNVDDQLRQSDDMSQDVLDAVKENPETDEREDDLVGSPRVRNYKVQSHSAYSSKSLSQSTKTSEPVDRLIDPKLADPEPTKRQSGSRRKNSGRSKTIQQESVEMKRAPSNQEESRPKDLNAPKTVSHHHQPMEGGRDNSPQMKNYPAQSSQNSPVNNPSGNYPWQQTQWLESTRKMSTNSPSNMIPTQQRFSGVQPVSYQPYQQPEYRNPYLQPIIGGYPGGGIKIPPYHAMPQSNFYPRSSSYKQPPPSYDSSNEICRILAPCFMEAVKSFASNPQNMALIRQTAGNY